MTFLRPFATAAALSALLWVSSTSLAHAFVQDSDTTEVQDAGSAQDAAPALDAKAPRTEKAQIKATLKMRVTGAPADPAEGASDGEPVADVEQRVEDFTDTLADDAALPEDAGTGDTPNDLAETAIEVARPEESAPAAPVDEPAEAAVLEATTTDAEPAEIIAIAEETGSAEGEPAEPAPDTGTETRAEAAPEPAVALVEDETPPEEPDLDALRAIALAMTGETLPETPPAPAFEAQADTPPDTAPQPPVTEERQEPEPVSAPEASVEPTPPDAVDAPAVDLDAGPAGDAILTREPETMPETAPVVTNAALLDAGDMGGLVDAVNDALNRLGPVQGRFEMVSASANALSMGGEPERREGAFSLVRREGKLRMEFDPQYVDPDLIVIDGATIRSRFTDFKREVEEVALAVTPLDVIFGSDIDLTRDANVIFAAVQGEQVRITMTDREGQFDGDISLVFDSGTLQLREWVVRDGYDVSTRVVLSAVEEVDSLPDRLFYLRETRRPVGPGR